MTAPLRSPRPTSIDVDYYMFTVDFEAVQTTGTFAAPTTANLIFDLDYADGLGRADTTLLIYEAEFLLRRPGRRN